MHTILAQNYKVWIPCVAGRLLDSRWWKIWKKWNLTIQVYQNYSPSVSGYTPYLDNNNHPDRKRLLMGNSNGNQHLKDLFLHPLDNRVWLLVLTFHFFISLVIWWSQLWSAYPLGWLLWVPLLPFILPLTFWLNEYLQTYLLASLHVTSLEVIIITIKYLMSCRELPIPSTSIQLAIYSLPVNHFMDPNTISNTCIIIWFLKLS